MDISVEVMLAMELEKNGIVDGPPLKHVDILVGCTSTLHDADWEQGKGYWLIDSEKIKTIRTDQQYTAFLSKAKVNCGYSGCIENLRASICCVVGVPDKLRCPRKHTDGHYGMVDAEGVVHPVMNWELVNVTNMCKMAGWMTRNIPALHYKKAGLLTFPNCGLYDLSNSVTDLLTGPTPTGVVPRVNQNILITTRMPVLPPECLLISQLC